MSSCRSLLREGLLRARHSKGIEEEDITKNVVLVCPYRVLSITDHVQILKRHHWKCGELISHGSTSLHCAQLILERMGTVIDNNHSFPDEKLPMANSLKKSSSATSAKVAMILLRPFITKLPHREFYRSFAE